MTYSRRDLSLLLGALAASGAAAEDTTLPSKTYKFQDLPVKKNSANVSRAVFSGKTHAGYHVDIHLTELGPGERPHPPHHHVHEEMIMIHEGTMEVTISGRTTTIGPGSVAYVASNEEHGWRNVGGTHALYFVLALGRDTPA